MKKTIAILGATGSIGLSALSVLRANLGSFDVWALSAHRRIDDLCRLCIEFRPRFAVVDTEEQQKWLRHQLSDLPIEILVGQDGLLAVVQSADIVLSGIVGASGLPPVYEAAKKGKTILIANKEALVVGGGVFMKAVHSSGANLIPLDSEHNAIFQSLPFEAQRDLSKTSALIDSIVLTASGGPFLRTNVADLSHMSVEQACQHPNWSMGKKISVDSATMMNKALEMIEAGYLFGLEQKQIEVVVHPQSVVHSLVRYRDGSLLAQMGVSDMKIPIAHALGYPDRILSGALNLDLTRLGRLDFMPVDLDRFPAISLARSTMDAGHAAAVVFNAANEEAVTCFLEGKIRFTEIYPCVEKALSVIPRCFLDSLEDVILFDADVRRWVKSDLQRCVSC